MEKFLMNSFAICIGHKIGKIFNYERFVKILNVNCGFTGMQIFGYIGEA